MTDRAGSGLQPVQAALARIGSLLERGEVASAEHAYRQLPAQAQQLPASVHMLGLIRERGGDTAGAAQLLRRSVELEPRNPHFQLNLAQFLRRMGRSSEAEAVYRRTLELSPHAKLATHGLVLTLVEGGRAGDAESECRAALARSGADAEMWALLAYVLSAQGRSLDAEAAYRRALEADPRHATARQNLGALLVARDQAEEGLLNLQQARAAGSAGVELLMNEARAFALLYRNEEAERTFAAAVALEPRRVDAQLDLARLRYMAGEPRFARDLEAAAARFPDDLRLAYSLVNVLRAAGREGEAEERVRALLAAAGPRPEVQAVLAQLLHETGRLDEAVVEARKAAAQAPDNAVVVESLVSVLLSLQAPGEALPHIAAQRLARPTDQTWIAHETTAARLRADPAHAALCDYDRFVRLYDLEPPAGWRSMDELNAAVRESLGPRLRAASHPLDQSLRNGSQTMRNLVAEGDPAIRALLAAFEAPLQDYVASIGTAAAHPLTSRNTGAARILGAWSVELRAGGFHVNHVHPQGWISSAYYIEVPPETRGDDRAGWLKFGEPRFPVPGLAAQRHVQPRAGRLVLFPAYFWHGTQPIHEGARRLTVAFDAVPAAQPRSA